LFEDITDIYEETAIEHVSIPKIVYRKKGESEPLKSYQHLTDVLNMTNMEFFTLTALIGKFIVGERKKLEDSREQFFKYIEKKSKSNDNIVILKALAVDEVNNIYILKDYEKMRIIWQEYSYAGFEELYCWYEDNSIDFETKLSEVLLETFNNNKKLINDEDLE